MIVKINNSFIEASRIDVFYKKSEKKYKIDIEVTPIVGEKEIITLDKTSSTEEEALKLQSSITNSIYSLLSSSSIINLDRF